MLSYDKHRLLVPFIIDLWTGNLVVEPFSVMIERADPNSPFANTILLSHSLMLFLFYTLITTSFFKLKFQQGVSLALGANSTTGQSMKAIKKAHLCFPQMMQCRKITSFQQCQKYHIQNQGTLPFNWNIGSSMLYRYLLVHIKAFEFAQQQHMGEKQLQSFRNLICTSQFLIFVHCHQH